MATAVFECARTREAESCSVRIIGEQGDVVKAAQDQLVHTHGVSAGQALEENVTAAVQEHETKYGIWGN